MEIIKSDERGNITVGLVIASVVIWGALSLFIKPESNSENSTFSEDSNRTGAELSEEFFNYEDYDCADFSSQSEAQSFFLNAGGPLRDYHDLDRDRDGIACEGL